ncbi:MAG TPA: hypothetical protein PLX06_02825 [Fimbriimonadaceae bacterium]|nr:hypothetical protein [Fimbriimonadaceae bacterium]
MKKVLLIVIPLLLVGGGVVGAAMMGVINIPGLTPAKKKANAVAQYAEEKEAEPLVENAPPSDEPEPTVVLPEAPPDLEKGRRSLAKLWNEMEAATLIAIVADWKDDELAEQMRFLDPEKTAELLSNMKPDRASKLSRLLQDIAAREKVKTA